MLPGGLTDMVRCDYLGMSEQRDEGEESQEGWGDPLDGEVGPLPLGLHTKMAAGLFKGDLQLPAQSKPGHNLGGDDRERGTQQCLRSELLLGVADQYPAQRHRWPAGVIPHRGTRHGLDGALAPPIPVRHGKRRPLRPRIGGNGGRGCRGGAGV